MPGVSGTSEARLLSDYASRAPMSIPAGDQPRETVDVAGPSGVICLLGRSRSQNIGYLQTALQSPAAPRGPALGPGALRLTSRSGTGSEQARLPVTGQREELVETKSVNADLATPSELGQVFAGLLEREGF